MKKALVLVCVFLAVLFLLKPSAQEKIIPEPPSKKEVPSFRKNLLDLHNKERTGWGYSPLEMDDKLCEYAQKHAEKMSREERLNHSKMSDLQKVNDSNAVGENIAWGQEDEATAVSAWMWSPMHRWNILGSSYKKAGFGASKDSEGRYYWCVVFSD